MTKEEAKHVCYLVNEIKEHERMIQRLQKERAAELTGLDPDTPGGRHHILQVMADEWAFLGLKCAEFFVNAMDAVIKDVDDELSMLKAELERLQLIS